MTISEPDTASPRRLLPEDQRPKEAVPLDMHEGGFGHRGEDCTFETLAKAFRISDKRVA